MKDCKLSIIILLFLAIIVAFNTYSLRLKESKSDRDIIGFFDEQNPSKRENCESKD